MKFSKYILGLVITALLLTGCGGGSSNNTITTVKMLDINYEPLLEMDSSIDYDTNGNWNSKTTTYTPYTEDDERSSYETNTTYTYDFNQNTVLETFIEHLDPCDDLFCQGPTPSNIYSFNNEGVVLESYSEDNRSNSVYLYDEDGDVKTILIEVFYTDANVTGTYTLNKNMQVIEDAKHYVFNDNNEFVMPIESPVDVLRKYTYHTNGRVEIYDVNKTYDDRWEYSITTYDEDGNIIDSDFDSGSL